jgi:hypothetical protein
VGRSPNQSSELHSPKTIDVANRRLTLVGSS